MPPVAMYEATGLRFTNAVALSLGLLGCSSRQLLIV